MRVTIPETIIKIGEYGFCGSDLREVAVPESVTSIGHGAFCQCSALKKAVILGKASLEDFTFHNDTVLEEVDISNVISLGKSTFSDCRAMYKVSFPQHLDVIPDDTFNSCSSLKEFTISENVKRIGANAFFAAGIQGDFEIPANVIEIGESSFREIKIVNLTINANIKVIPKYAFYGNDNLVTLKIGEGITGIEMGSFRIYSASLDTVYLPSTLEYIVQDSFQIFNRKIQNVYFAGCETKWQNVLIASGNTSLTEASLHFSDHRSVYTYDDNDHWLVCEFCGLVTGERSPHVMNGNICTVCGYGAPEEHVHSFVYKTDVHVHWQYCEECGYTCNVEEHSFAGDICSKCNYEEVKETPSGDVNSDGEITLDDAIEVLKMAMKVNS